MENIIEMLNIRKVFPGVIANDDITLELRRGEIHALLGENGAGKSTLMSILFGMYQPDGGEIRIEGKTVKIKNPNDANRFHIGMVHQHFKLVHNFTATENIVLGLENLRHGLLDLKQARSRLEELTERYGLRVNFDILTSQMTVGMQQRVEILKMLYRDNDILIFDEPTVGVDVGAKEEIYKIMEELTAQGKGIILISSYLPEVMGLSDRLFVMAQGRITGEFNYDEIKVLKEEDVLKKASVEG